MKYLIHTCYCWYDSEDGEKLVFMYFIQNVPFTFDELPEIAKEDLELECNPLVFELELENPELVPID